MTGFVQGYDCGHAEAWRTLQRQTALAQLDSEWMVEREQYLVRGRGGPHVPTRDGGLVVRGWAWVFLGALGLLMVATFSFPPGATFSSPPGVLLFYALLIAFGAYEIRHGYRKAERYEAALAVYQRRRQALVDQAGPGNTA